MSENNVAFKCELCDEAIYVGEEYYDIPGVGKCCKGCIDDCHEDEAEDEAYNAYIDRMFEEERERRLFGE